MMEYFINENGFEIFVSNQRYIVNYYIANDMKIIINKGFNPRQKEEIIQWLRDFDLDDVHVLKEDYELVES